MVEGRLAHRDELDQRVEEWTRYYSPHQVMDALQRAGVPAGIVQDGGSLFRDPHLRERGFITTVDHPDTGPIEYPGTPVRMWETPGRLEWWHNMGQDNAYVFGTLLKMSPEEISTLQGSGVLS
ncbi:MAG: CoA transferase, partial [Dehalococcoidia bacterium]